MLRFFTALSTALLLCAAYAPARAGATFRPPPLSVCDGTGWGSLHFGVTTPKQIKSDFAIDLHNDIPRSLRLSQPADIGEQVNVLFVDKKDTDPLEAICLRPSPGALTLDALQAQVGESGQTRYSRTRSQDWWVEIFPTHCIVAFVLATPNGAEVRQVLLLPRAAMPQVVPDWSVTGTPLVPLIDPHAGEPRVMSFGSTLVTGSISGLPGNDRLKSVLERRMVDGIAGGAMRYAVGAGGSYETNLQGTLKDGKGDVTVECTIKGDGPYGPLSATASHTGSVRTKDDPWQITTDTAEKALSTAETNFARAMAASGPPTPDQVRLSAWEQLFQNMRQAAASGLATAG